MFNFSPVPIEWTYLLPIILLACTGVVTLTIEILRPKQNNNLIVTVTVIGLLATGFMVVQNMAADVGAYMGGLMVQDRFGMVMQLLVLVSVLLTVIFSEGYLREKRIPYGEFYPLVTWAAVGGMIMVSTTNLLMMFLGLEVLSISLYVLAGLSRSEQKSEESALKYFLLGAFSTGFLLYGIAMFYGATGSLQLESAAQAWRNNVASTAPLLMFSMGLLLVGLCFKASFVPFHQWTPDVYQGAPTNVAAFMAAGSKVGALAALWRILENTQMLKEFWLPALTVIAILTMTVGNLAALVQKDVKRILGYSSISHAGYVLVAIIANFSMGRPGGYETMAYYLMIYTLMTVGAFAVVSMVAREGQEGTRLESLHGLWRRAPLAAGALVLFMVSLIGMPPTAGFFGKYLIFMDALNAGQVLLAIVLAVNSILSVSYYLAIAKAVGVNEEETETVSAPFNSGLASACVVCAAGVIVAIVLAAPILDFLGGR